MKYIIGLLAICFYLISVDVGAVEQPIKTEFVCVDAPNCSAAICVEPVEIVFQVPLFVAAIYPEPLGESHGNQERSCGGSFENVITIDPSPHLEAPFIERYQNRTTDSAASVPAKENDDNCQSDFKVGWRQA